MQYGKGNVDFTGEKRRFADSKNRTYRQLLSELTKNQYLPQLIDKQRILVNIETLRQQLELIYTSGRSDVVRKAQVVAQALMAEAVFENAARY